MHGFICLETDDNLSGLTESNFDENPDAIDLALGFFCENKEEIVDLTHSFPRIVSLNSLVLLENSYISVTFNKHQMIATKQPRNSRFSITD